MMKRFCLAGIVILLVLSMCAIGFAATDSQPAITLDVSNTVRNMIVERVEEGILPDYSIAPFNTIRDDHDLYLSNNGVVIYFQQYEHWPYAAGIQEFPVEFSVLSDN